MASQQMPPITLSTDDLLHLKRLADSPRLHQAFEARLLLADIAGARVVPSNELPSDVVSMNSVVDCIDELTGTFWRFALVYPRDADITRDRVSVLSPVGMALLGTRVGQSIDYPSPAGRRLRLKVAACCGCSRCHTTGTVPDPGQCVGNPIHPGASSWRQTGIRRTP